MQLLSHKKIFNKGDVKHDEPSESMYEEGKGERHMHVGV